jgi:methyltransferase family protein
VLSVVPHPVRRHQRLRKLARRLGFHLVRADVYSPIPDPDAVPAATWTDAAPMPGVDLRLDASLDLLERDLAPFIAEYEPRHGYDRSNPMYPAVDGVLLYAMLRHLRPRRVVEVGAGWSSLVVSDALERNAAPVERRVYDPLPSSVLQGRVDVLATPAEQIPGDVFGTLAGGDVLIVDTTHAVRPGGDVVRLLLEVLPGLAPGVVVHVHDFFRPFEYPRFLVDLGLYWQEHHLLQAFLAHNDAFDVLLAGHALARLRPERMRAAIPGDDRLELASALWLRRRDG